MRLARLKYDCRDIKRLEPYWIFNRHVSFGLWDLLFLPAGTRSDRISGLLCHDEGMRRRGGLVEALQSNEGRISNVEGFSLH